MQQISATYARKEWSTVVDSVVREKPAFIKRTRDSLILADIHTFEAMLESCRFTAAVFIEEDGSVTLSLDQLDLIENDTTQDGAIKKLGAAILEYSEDFYSDYAYWARGDRKKHIPYVFKALLLGDPEKIGGIVECRHGET